MIQFQPYNVLIDGTLPPGRTGGMAPNTLADWMKMYEEQVRRTVNAVAHTKIGHLVLASFYAKVPVRIIPWLGESCNARTGQLSSNWSKGIGIQFSADMWSYDQCGKYPGYRAVETLFHEMVHASRFTNYGFAGMMNDQTLRLMQDPEEFLAVMVTNMFRQEQGAHKLNRDYQTGRLVSQTELEAFLSSDAGYLDAIEAFLGDPLVKSLLKVTTPFNPFRDLQRLRANTQASAVRRGVPA